MTGFWLYLGELVFVSVVLLGLFRQYRIERMNEERRERRLALRAMTWMTEA